jgi:hypothetical protein
LIVCGVGAGFETGDADMRFSLVIFVLLLLFVGGGAVFLMTYDIPAPSQQIEKVIPNDRFPR